MTDMRSDSTPAAAITGAGAGLGNEIALGLAQHDLDYEPVRAIRLGATSRGQAVVAPGFTPAR